MSDAVYVMEVKAKGSDWAFGNADDTLSFQIDMAEHYKTLWPDHEVRVTKFVREGK